ncbi:MAG TPA: PilZ domain-containing protein [Rhizobiaceae bacterium]|nr:PilZ domain-containing protein [Rhizobiaceae bacterium]
MALGLAYSEMPSHDRRTFQRVKVKLHGRFMLPNRTEHVCQVVDMSPGSVALRATARGMVGERVVAYIDHIGRIEGKVTRTTPDGFAMTVNATARKRDKLAAQLTWLANKHELDLPEDRRHERVVPRNPISVMTLDDGRQYQCRIIDLSLSGAAVETSVRPALGTPVTLGAMRGTVVRHFDEGIAVEFAVVQRRESLKPYIGDEAQ